MNGNIATIVGNENYAVSRDGTVWSRFGRNGRPLRNGELRQLAPGVTSRGYLSVSLQGVSYLVHRLVCQAFVGAIPDGHQVNHIDGNKRNNMASNLEVVSPQENIAHAIRHGLNDQRGQNNANSKLSDDAVRSIRSLAQTGLSAQEIARTVKTEHEVTVSVGYVNQLVAGRYRNSVEPRHNQTSSR